MVEAFFGFKKTPFSDSPDAKQLFASQAWLQVKARLQFLVDHHGAGLLTGEVGAGKSTAARTFTAGLNPNLYKILYLHWTSGSALDLLRQIALELGLEPAHTAATWRARSRKRSCISTRTRSSIPFSSATRPNNCAIRPGTVLCC